MPDREDAKTDDVLVSNPKLPKAKLSATQKMVIAALLCLQIPSGALCYPAATVIILTGVGAPISMVLWRIGTMPYAMAMQRKAAWQSGENGALGGSQPPGLE
jgi:hypothetical protein